MRTAERSISRKDFGEKQENMNKIPLSHESEDTDNGPEVMTLKNLISVLIDSLEAFGTNRTVT